MLNGPKSFAEIATFLKASLVTDPSSVDNDEDIEEVCILYRYFYLLLDSSFSFIYNIKNRKATIGEVHVLKERLKLVRQKWLTIGLSFTPKVDLFLDCVIDQIHEIKGCTTLGEDRIEIAHQRRHQIAS